MPPLTLTPSWGSTKSARSPAELKAKEEARREREDWTWIDYGLRAVLATQAANGPNRSVPWISEKAYAFEVGSHMQTDKKVGGNRPGGSLRRSSTTRSFLKRILEDSSSNDGDVDTLKDDDEKSLAPPSYSSRPPSLAPLSRASTVPSYSSRDRTLPAYSSTQSSVQSLSRQSSTASSVSGDSHEFSLDSILKNSSKGHDELSEEVREEQVESFEEDLLKALDDVLDRALQETSESDTNDTSSMLSRSSTFSSIPASSVTNLTLSDDASTIRSSFSDLEAEPTPPSSQIDPEVDEIWNPLSAFDTDGAASDIMTLDDGASMTSASDLASVDDRLLNEALEFTHHLAPTPTSLPRLNKPIAIPQITHGLGSPFPRSYAPILESYGISDTDFLAFIDNFNIITTRSPPLALMLTMANVASMVPFDMAQLASGVLRIASEVGTVMICRKRLRSYMRRANAEMFAPRGLKIECCGGRKLKHVLGLEKDSALVAPLETISDRMDDVGVMDRRLEAIGEYISELTFEVPPPGKQTKILSRLSELQVQRDMRSAEKRLLKRRKKIVEKKRKMEEKKGGPVESRSQVRYDKAIAKLEAEIGEKKLVVARRDGKAEELDGSESLQLEKKLSKNEQKVERDVQQLERRRTKIEFQLQRGTAKEKRRQEKRDSEMGVSKTVFWLLIRNLDDADLPNLPREKKEGFRERRKKERMGTF